MKRKIPAKFVTLVIIACLLMATAFATGCSPREETTVDAAEPIVIGAPLPIGFLYGWAPERAMKVAVEEINEQGGVDVGGENRPLELRVLDTRDLEPAVPVIDALLGVERLILQEGADFLIGGPARSEAALAAMDLISRHERMAIFTTGFLSPDFQEMIASDPEHYKYNFRMSNSAGNMVGEKLEVFDFLQEEYGFERAAVMVQDVAHARSGGAIMGEQLEGMGWEVEGPFVYPTGTIDFAEGLFRVMDFEADVMFIWMDMPESSILLRQWHDLEVPSLPIGFICAAEQPGFWEATEGKGEYTMVNLVNAGNAPTEVTPQTMDFVNAYEDKWGLEPEGYGASSSYQAVYTLVDAIERAGTDDVDAVVEAMKETDMEGIYGRVRFDETNQIIPSFNPDEGAVPQVIQWLDGNRETVYPLDIATDSITLPPWMEEEY